MILFLTCIIFSCTSFNICAENPDFHKAADSFLGKPYVAATLERNPTESLIINLDEVDCTTFLEYVTASLLSHTSPDTSGQNYRIALQAIRYRNGIINGYFSRLHYFSDWIRENTSKGYITEITASLGAPQGKKKIDFMSTHPLSYPALRNEPALIDSIRLIEKQLSETPVRILPKGHVKEVESQLCEGDLIAIATAIEGLDISHVGFAVRINGRIHLMHASSDAKKVIIDPLPLHDYLQKSRKATGIRVLRVNSTPGKADGTI